MLEKMLARLLYWLGLNELEEKLEGSRWFLKRHGPAALNPLQETYIYRKHLIENCKSDEEICEHITQDCQFLYKDIYCDKIIGRIIKWVCSGILAYKRELENGYEEDAAFVKKTRLCACFEILQNFSPFRTGI